MVPHREPNPLPERVRLAGRPCRCGRRREPAVSGVALHFAGASGAPRPLSMRGAPMKLNLSEQEIRDLMQLLYRAKIEFECLAAERGWPGDRETGALAN